ncbi:hypothetical protein OC846_001588 [Tilletia horrida]|uniref:Uncharacterized protein n=1 Tax=Tilletia horrida TaxID=155126 RepID=A0AAN6GYL4_9BASI|nr:hypothetical protein OC846_001588 [Tilletia horrida]KAK0569494.1 hypothetical protein OC861_000867 [Tilletia horrida]
MDFEYRPTPVVASAGLPISKSFPSWSHLASSSPPSSSHGSGSGHSDSSGSSSPSLPSYSVNRHVSMTFSFPLPPGAAPKDIRDLASDRDQKSAIHEPPPYAQTGEDQKVTSEVGECPVQREQANVARLKASYSLLRLPAGPTHKRPDAQSEVTPDDHNKVNGDRSIPSKSGQSSDDPFEFDQDDLQRLAALLQGLPAALNHDGNDAQDVNTQDPAGAFAVPDLQGRSLSQSPILSGLLSAASSQAPWEVDIALEPHQQEGDAQVQKEPAILRLELSPIEVAQLFSIPIALASPPRLDFDAHDISGAEITVDDLFQGIELSTSSSNQQVVNTTSEIQDILEQVDHEVSEESDLVVPEILPDLEASPIAPSLTDFDMIKTPPAMEALPTPDPQGTGAYSGLASIAKLLESAKPVGVTISVPGLARTVSVKGQVGSSTALNSPHPMLSPLSTVMKSPEATMLNTPASLSCSVLNRPRPKPRGNMSSFFGTNRRDIERKLTAEKPTTSRSSTADLSGFSASRSLGSIALPSTMLSGEARPAIPQRKSSHGYVLVSPEPMGTVDESTSMDGADNLDFEALENARSHDSGSSPAAYWKETKDVLGGSTGGAGACQMANDHSLIKELRRQRAATLDSTPEQPPKPVVHHHVPVTLQKTRASAKREKPTTVASSINSPSRVSISGQIFKAFRRSSRSPAPASTAAIPVDSSTVTPDGTPAPKADLKSLPMEPSTSQTSFKTSATSQSSRSVATSAISAAVKGSKHPQVPHATASAAGAHPLVLRGQALQDVKVACQQKAALIRAAAMLAAAEEQRVAAGAAYRAAEAALLASRRQASKASAGSNDSPQREAKARAGSVGGPDRSDVETVPFMVSDHAPRRYDVPSIRPVKRKPVATSPASGQPKTDQPSTAAETVLLSL